MINFDTLWESWEPVTYNVMGSITFSPEPGITISPRKDTESDEHIKSLEDEVDYAAEIIERLTVGLEADEEEIEILNTNLDKLQAANDRQEKYIRKIEKERDRAIQKLESTWKINKKSKSVWDYWPEED